MGTVVELASSSLAGMDDDGDDDDDDDCLADGYVPYTAGREESSNNCHSDDSSEESGHATNGCLFGMAMGVAEQAGSSGTVSADPGPSTDGVRGEALSTERQSSLSQLFDSYATSSDSD